MSSPAFLPVHTLAAEIAARRLSPVDLVDEYLARIERLDPKLHAFVSVNAANARLAAEAADKAIRSGHAVGPLHGIPIAIKDLVEIEGEVALGGTAAVPGATGSALAHRDLAPEADGDGGGDYQPGQNPYGGVRLRRLGHERASRHALESLGSIRASRARRFLLGFGRGRRRPPRALGHRDGHRRVGARAGRVNAASPGLKTTHAAGSAPSWRAAAEPTRWTRPARSPGSSRTPGCC